MRIVAAKDFTPVSAVDQSYEKERDIVLDMINQIRQHGDAALQAFTRRFDGVDLTDFRIPQHVYAAAYQQVTPQFTEALREAIQNIRRYHEAQRRQSYMLLDEHGTTLGQLIRPLQRVGVYVPGGTAAYPSTVLMNVIPAQVAGVPEIVVVTPPDKEGNVHPGVLVALQELGIQEAYRVGGAQAVAALAYGTESIRPVDKIVGPGNIYVALAKQAVFGKVSIESIAGPSDILVVADDTADPEYVAADLLSQAEHGELSQAILVTPSSRLAEQTAYALEQQLARLPRQEIAAASIRNRGAIIITSDLAEAIEMANRIAPEHLELIVEEPDPWLARIVNAGAIFVGTYSTEPVGDYFCGTNHVLPTEGTARFSSPLNVDDFLKKTSLVRYSKTALLQHGEKIIALAESEGLEAHANAVRIRLQKEDDKL
ncbi:histidinol dehydrogenase [Effusibacillus dendaii]|uniref:histidinol dehydrogenase n=1 Tax=Effusibacillus dendaii TaxID=2743772 RepID=UPI00190C5538|nr:histidinol dehydrogenase [Effusibacillus dendaii]